MKLRDIYGSYQPFMEKSLRAEQRPHPIIQKPIRTVLPPKREPEPKVGEVDSIVAAWRRVAGIELNPEIVLKHLATIRRWQRQGGGSGTADTYQDQTYEH